ncbi:MULTISPECIES: hypothetical protein [Streptomyces]|uniref:hypothetical protein n=1 Tax=Streptomyces TaxID=1883 RepID=UPI000A9387AB|nr:MULTISPECIES: hypothetical protein [Streptomyces]WSC65453.1 hypothetical protein OHA57_33855 [Streptomyces anulatus]WSV78946.1 hypothetical protein OG333_33285 [Streptomyces anulatus]WTC61802.1 hypothetical protein OG865_04450 [Streptomyces anulatus]WUC85303.1 hypothetical protein OHQ35_04180 [Streptomyces anulatus]WUD87441.1 hypothetical protein OG703_04550 [Streptomyces anulatus]
MNTASIPAVLSETGALSESDHGRAPLDTVPVASVTFTMTACVEVSVCLTGSVIQLPQ